MSKGKTIGSLIDGASSGINNNVARDIANQLPKRYNSLSDIKFSKGQDPTWNNTLDEMNADKLTTEQQAILKARIKQEIFADQGLSSLQAYKKIRDTPGLLDRLIQPTTFQILSQKVAAALTVTTLKAAIGLGGFAAVLYFVFAPLAEANKLDGSKYNITAIKNTKYKGSVLVFFEPPVKILLSDQVDIIKPNTVPDINSYNYKLEDILSSTCIQINIGDRLLTQEGTKGTLILHTSYSNRMNAQTNSLWGGLNVMSSVQKLIDSLGIKPVVRLVKAFIVFVVIVLLLAGVFKGYITFRKYGKFFNPFSVLNNSKKN
jgi:hypothetical protein